jgi:hypothetical protein
MHTPAPSTHADAWRKRSAQLAAFADEHLVNRRDAYGRYIAVERRRDPDLSAVTEKRPLTAAALQRHFAGVSTGDLIGLHSTVRDEPTGEGEVAACWSRWLAVDVDRHTDATDPAATWRAAREWYDRAVGLGFMPLLIESNGRGGYHLWLIFDGPVPTAQVFRFGRWMVRDWQELGLAEAPECFPKQAEIGPGGFGNWLRLPGRHHTRECWSRIWGGTAWLEGDAAVEAILGARPTPATAIPAEALVAERRPAAPNRPVRRADLDRDARLAAEALEHVRHLASDYDRWIEVGQCLTALNGVGLDLWDNWSRNAPDKYENDACERKWRSFNRNGAGGRGLGTLFHLAKQSGWKGPRERPDTSLAPARPAAKRATVIEVQVPGDDVPPDLEQIEIRSRWPRAENALFHGLAGEIAWNADPYTESDAVGTLVQVLVAYANMIGRGPHFVVAATQHFLNLFVVLAGMTALGRKGSSWDIARWIVSRFDEDWARNRIQSGLVSGEGLIFHCRDPRYETREVRAGGKKSGPVTGTETVLVDAGVADKRLLIVESEFSRTLKACNRESNTLSDVLRDAWDRNSLSTLGKNCPVQATGAHISIIAHATQSDIRTHLTDNNSANGFANRFLWTSVRRSKVLPDGGDLFLADWTRIEKRMERAVLHGRNCGRMARSSRAGAVWRDVYEGLSSGRPGLLGAILSRAEAQVMRVACVYALLDASAVVEVEHLQAALALWRYCEGSARLIFGDALGDPRAEKLLATLKETPEGLTRTEVYVKVFGRKLKTQVVADLLSDLYTRGLIHRFRNTETGGRASEVWRLGAGPRDGDDDGS